VTESKQLSVDLDEFHTVADELDDGGYILHVPPARERPIQNEELYERMRSDEHYERVVRD